MKKQKHFILAQITSRSAFFMPCIMVYTLIYISFILWQVTEVLDYQKLSIEYSEFVQFESAMYAASNYTKELNDMYYESSCVAPLIPTNDFKTQAYEINYKTYCVREPGVTNLIIPGDTVIKPAFKTINESPLEVDQQTYQQLMLNLETISITEMMFEWIGLPIDAVPTKIDQIQYASVQKMPCILFTDITITTDEKTKNFLVKYNCRTQKVEKVIHT